MEVIITLQHVRIFLILISWFYKSNIFNIFILVENTAQNAQTVSELPKELMDNELLPKYKRDLVAKLKCLRAELNALQPQSGHCRLEVSRNEIFEVSV